MGESWQFRARCYGPAGPQEVHTESLLRVEGQACPAWGSTPSVQNPSGVRGHSPERGQVHSVRVHAECEGILLWVRGKKWKRMQVTWRKLTK